MNFQDVIRESYDDSNKALKVNTVAGGSGQATVVIDGIVNSITTIANVPLNTQIVGNVTLTDSKTYIGLVSVGGGTLKLGSNSGVDIGDVDVTSLPALSASNNFIGLVTVANTVSTTFSGNVTLDAGSKTQIVGNVTLSGSLPAGVNNIGFATVAVSNPTLYAVVNTGAAGVGNSIVTINPRTDYFGLVSVSGNVNVGTPTVFVGTPTLHAVVNTATAGIQNSLTTILNPVSIAGNITIDSGVITTITNPVGLAAGVNNIGFASVTVINTSRSIAGNITIDSGVITTITNPVALKGNITINSGTITAVTDITNPVAIKGNITINSGTITAVTDITNPIALKGNVTLSDSKTFIGSVTAWSRNAGTTKTLIPKTIELSTSSVATIAVATATWKMTHLLLSSNATTRVSIKSGATYLTGNASIGVTLLPGGGWVENGSPDSPIYVGLAAAQSIVVEKFDLTGTSALVGGKVMYFDE